MPEPAVFDSSVAGFAFRRDTRFGLYLPELESRLRVLPLQAVAELRLMARLADWGDRRRAELETFILGHLVAEPDEPTATIWADLMAASRRAGRRLEAADCWIAATAVRVEGVLLTHDRDLADLAFPGLTVVCRR